MTAAQWIWSPDEPSAPKNRFTYFRKVVQLDGRPADATLLFAADSNAQLWINGQAVRRKVTRYHEPNITAEVINAAAYLRTGPNVLLVLHHNWGDIVTFQRSGNAHAGLYLASDWVVSDESWQCTRAPQFVAHEQQIMGVSGDPRIRYPVIIDGAKVMVGDLHDAALGTGNWSNACVVSDGPWPAEPARVETPGQREYAVHPLSVLAAGRLDGPEASVVEPRQIAAVMKQARCTPDEAMSRAAASLVDGRPYTLDVEAGRSYYLTFDFGAPVHGYPFLAIEAAPAGAMIDLGYGEIARSIYSGKPHVTSDGWIDTEGVVGTGYADRYIAPGSEPYIEFPDERTARWLTLHIHAPTAGRLCLTDVGIIKSQYPVDRVGSFACGHERVEQIVKLCLIHAEVSMSDTYVDTTGREDGQWIEDARPRARLATRWFGDVALLQLMIRTLAEGQTEDGNLHPFSPSNYPIGGAPYDWSVQWVAMLQDDYEWTNDTSRIKRFWPVLTRYWELLLQHVDNEGLWRTKHLFTDIRVGVQLDDERQSSGMVTPWIIERLRWSAGMARAIGEEDQARQWQGIADRMTAAFHRHHVVEASGEVPCHVANRVDPDNPGIERGYSQAGQTVAVTSSLLSPEQARATLAYAFGDPDGSPPAGVTRWNNPTYGYRVLAALSHVGMHERAVAHLLERYAPYLPNHPRNPTPAVLQGPYGGPLPEYWVSREDLELGPDAVCTPLPVDETGSHGWGAVPLLWMHEYLLGVQILEPGGGRLRIAPATGGLPFVAGHTATPKGLVWVNWDPQRMRLEIDLPAGVTAELVTPEPAHSLTMDVQGVEGAIQPMDAAHHRLDGHGRYRLCFR